MKKTAERRMFAKTVIDSDAFLDMPMSAQCLYFHLAMRADDDGFLNNPKKIQRMIGASEDDLKILIMKRFVLTFDTGVIVIKHWKLHNYIRNDRYKPTVYKDEKALLIEKENGSYSFGIPDGIPDGYQMDTQDRLGKDRLEIGKVNTISSHPSDASPKAKPVYEIILNDKTMYPIYQEDVEKWQELYPAVDVHQEIRNMVGWCDANPQKRKTRRGAKAFITNWLSREQNKPHVQSNQKPLKAGMGTTEERQAKYGFTPTDFSTM